jgi:hypothetical protein
LNSLDIKKQIHANGGKAMFKTVSGDELTVTVEGDSILIRDKKGDTAHITIANVF